MPHSTLKQLVFAQVEVHLQAVGHHGLDLERGREASPTDLDGRVPVPGGRVRHGAEREGVEVADGVGVGDRVNHLARRIEESQGGRVVGRQGIVGVVEHEGQMDVVAGAPHPALPVDHPLEPFRDDFAAHLEVARRQRPAGAHLEVAFLAAPGGHRVVGFRGKRGAGQSPGSRYHGFERLVLVVHEGDRDAAHRFGGAKVRRGDQDAAAGVPLCGHADVRGQEVPRVARPRGPAEVGVEARVVAVPPVDGGIDPVPTARRAPRGLQVGRPRFLEHGDQILFFAAREGGVAAVERQGQTDQAARVGAHQIAHVQRVPRPPPARFFRQLDRAPPQRAPGAPEFAAAGQVVGLQELPDVGLVHAKGRHLHRAHVGRLDGDGQPVRTREHHAAPGEAHARLHIDKGHQGLAALLEPLAVRAPQPLLQHDSHRSDDPVPGDDPKGVALHLQRHALVAQTHQPGEVLVRVERVGKPDQRVLAVVRLGAHGDDPEHIPRGDRDVLDSLRGGPDAPSVPAQPDLVVAPAAGHALNGEAMIHPVGVVLPANLQVGPVLLGAEDALHGPGLREVGGHDRSGQDQIVLLSGLRLQPVHKDLQTLVQDAEVERVVAQIVGQAQQTFPDECGVKLLPRRQVGGGCEDQLARADEGGRALHLRLEEEQAVRGAADQVLARHILGEDDRDPVALRNGAVGTCADQRVPARVGCRGVGLGASRKGEGGEGGGQAGVVAAGKGHDRLLRDGVECASGGGKFGWEGGWGKRLGAGRSCRAFWRRGRRVVGRPLWCRPWPGRFWPPAIGLPAFCGLVYDIIYTNTSK